MPTVKNPEVECYKCGQVFVLIGLHEIKPGTRFRCPSIDCSTIIVIKPFEVLKTKEVKNGR